MQTFRGNKTERKVTSETKNIEDTIDNKLGTYIEYDLIRIKSIKIIYVIFFEKLHSFLPPNSYLTCVYMILLR